MSRAAFSVVPARLDDAAALTPALEPAGTRHDVLPPRMHTRGADVLYRSQARAAPP